MGDPETLEDALEMIERMNEEIKGLEEQIDGLNTDLSSVEDERNLAQGRLDDLEGSPALQDAAELVMAEVTRPTGRIYEMTLPDTQAARAALLALSDALGRVP